MYTPPFSEVVLRVRNRLRGGFAIPRPRYLTAVIGAPKVDYFLRSGRDSVEAIAGLLRQNGIDPRTIDTALEFGCGVGRILRQWGSDRPRHLHGTDYNPKLIEWCRRNYRFATFSVNPLAGPLPYDASTFDLVYAWSVFTHLDVDLCRQWMAELARVVKPDGVLYATFHGEFYVGQMTGAERAAFDAGETVVRRGEASGSNVCATFHPRPAVERLASPYFTIVDSCPGTLPYRPQTQYLLRARPAPAMR